MRPVFIIYCAASISLIFALISAVSHGFVAQTISQSIVEHKAQGETRAEAEAQLDKEQNTMMLNLCLAATQTIIIFTARKISKQQSAAQRT